MKIKLPSLFCVTFFCEEKKVTKVMILTQPQNTILHIDLNSFFASAEQQANPFLRNKPMGVGNRNYMGSAILAASYPAKAKGIGLSTRYSEALRIDPEFQMAQLDPLKYYHLHNIFIRILNRYTPIVEVYSIDEAFLDLTHVYKTDLEEVCFGIKHAIIQEMGEAITCSIGIGANKLLAKIGSNHDKPDGITHIKWEQRFDYLDYKKLEDVWGIGYRVSKKMYRSGVYKLGQIRKMPDNDLYKIIGSYYTRLKLTAQGYHFEQVKSRSETKPPQSMQHAHTLSDATKDYTKLAAVARKMSERLAIRLREKHQKAKAGYIGFAVAYKKDYGWNNPGWYSFDFHFDIPTQHGKTIYDKCKFGLHEISKQNNLIRRLVVGVYNLSLPDQISLEDTQSSNIAKLDTTFDHINNRFGQFKLRSADIMHEYAKDTELSIDRHDMRFHGKV